MRTDGIIHAMWFVAGIWLGLFIAQAFPGPEPHCAYLPAEVPAARCGLTSA